MMAASINATSYLASVTNGTTLVIPSTTYFSLDNVAHNGTTDVTNVAGTPEQSSLFIEILKQVYLVTLPTICIIGVIGNILAFFVFMAKPLRRTSCSWYLASRSISDGGFLLATFLTWSSDASKLMFFHTEGLCQVIVFMTYVFAFLSVWFTVVVTVENYIRICRPFSVQTFCTVSVAQRVIGVMVLLGIVLYNFPFWTNEVHTFKTPLNTTFTWCNTLEKYAVMLRWLSFWDMLITLVVPSFLIILLMVAITFSLVKSLKRQSRLQAGGRSSGQDQRSTRSQRSNCSPQAKVTRMLFAVSFFFILLNGPSHIIRMKIAILDFIGERASSASPSVEEQVQVIFQIIYYLSFAVNLVIYLTCGNSFRKQFVGTYLGFCSWRRSRGPCNEMTVMSTVRLEEMDNNKHEEQTNLIKNGKTTDKEANANNTGS